jgi:hypothetical protein
MGAQQVAVVIEKEACWRAKRGFEVEIEGPRKPSKELAAEFKERLTTWS